MYLEHFGLSEHPFKITPLTEFFFSGAHRKEILDALIYSISEVEGIIKVSGEVGSGKTMICRMLLEQLPANIEPIYLANPSLSREEMLYAIADALDLDINGARVGVIMQNIQNKLEDKAREGKRVVVLVDEAHAMPPDTLEELRLLYNLQVSHAKLLQIVLFGQPELNTKLDQPNMRQLKDRIVHHFHLQPLSRNILESYLMFRMRAAGYRGPNIFSAAAIKLIASASKGLMRRANILADKSLLAAFVEDTHNIEIRHVQAAMRDSEIRLPRTLPEKPLMWAGGAATAFVLAGLATWLMPVKPQTAAALQPAAVEATVAAPAIADESTRPDIPAEPTPKPAPTAIAATAPPSVLPAAAPTDDSPAQPKASLLSRRLSAGQQLLTRHQSTSSIQLFYSEEIQPAKMEGFLKRAEGLGKLSEIYLLPTQSGGKNGLRVLYGAYPSVDAARNAIKYLPTRYQEAFATSIYTY